MRAMRARGHEVIGVCADGPLLDGAARRGLPDRGPAARAQRLAAGALARIPRAGAAVSRASGRTSCTRTCRSAASLRGWRRGGPGCRASPTPGHGFWFNQPGLLAARRCRLRDGMAGGARDRHVPDGQSRRRRATRSGCTSIATPIAIGNGRDPARFRPDPGRPPAGPRRARRAGRSGGGARGVAPGLAQGLSRTGGGHARRCRMPSCGWWASG